MNVRRTLAPLMASAFLLAGCGYIVTPQDEATSAPISTHGWHAVATKIDAAGAGGLHIDVTIQNLTGDWSAMQASASDPAVLTTGDGHTTTCTAVFVGTGGTSLAPGFQMSGYTAGTDAAPKTQPLYVECAGASPSPGSKLAIPYSYVTGDFNYYTPATPTKDRLEVDLDKVAADLKYPVADPVADLATKPGAKIDAINKCTLTLTSVTRTADGLTFAWQTENPTEYPAYVHIGVPPVIGSDGVIYGIYQSPHLADAPITLAGQTAEWTTTVTVPADVTGLYILLSVESKQQKTFVSHAVDITDK